MGTAQVGNYESEGSVFESRRVHPQETSEFRGDCGLQIPGREARFKTRIVPRQNLERTEVIRHFTKNVTPAAMWDFAMPIVTQRKPDLVILDIMLPGKSGYDLCREIRANSVRKTVRSSGGGPD